MTPSQNADAITREYRRKALAYGAVALLAIIAAVAILTLLPRSAEAFTAIPMGISVPAVFGWLIYEVRAKMAHDISTMLKAQ